MIIYFISDLLLAMASPAKLFIRSTVQHQFMTMIKKLYLLISPRTILNILIRSSFNFKTLSATSFRHSSLAIIISHHLSRKLFNYYCHGSEKVSVWGREDSATAGKEGLQAR